MGGHPIMPGDNNEARPPVVLVAPLPPPLPSVLPLFREDWLPRFGLIDDRFFLLSLLLALLRLLLHRLDDSVTM